MPSTLTPQQGHYQNPSQTPTNYHEQKAVEYLRAHHYHILERNFRWGRNEIDIISLTPKGTLVFAEVKYRRDKEHFSAERTFAPAQQARIIKASQGFMNKHPFTNDLFAQYDFLFFSSTHKQIQHMQNAFGNT